MPLSNKGPIAQLVEQLTLNQRVAGSSPARLTSSDENGRLKPPAVFRWCQSCDVVSVYSPTARILSCMSLTFEWDEEKAAENLTKHGVSFSEASTVFADPLSRTIADPLHSEREDRFVILGQSGLPHTRCSAYLW